MPENWMNRRLLLTSLCAIAIAVPGFAQHTDGADNIEHGSDKGKGKGPKYKGGRSMDDHGDGHGDDSEHASGGDDHGDDSDHASGGDDHGDDADHASGGKGKGPKYKGGRSVVNVSGGRGHSLEDRVLKSQPFE